MLNHEMPSKLKEGSLLSTKVPPLQYFCDYNYRFCI